MTTQRFGMALTVVNLVILMFTLTHSRPATADAVTPAPADTVAPVLRGRALEIVDEHGKVRASISVFPADPSVKMPDGTTGYPETVLLRLRDSNGHPNVKLEANNRGGGIGFGGEDDPTYASLGAKGSSTSLKLKNKDGRERIVTP